MAIYNNIGSSYNSTRKADPKICNKMIAHLQPHVGGRYLDLACGTGNYTLEYKRAEIQITGVDQSELMIEQAKGRDPSIHWEIGEAESLPFERDSFDGITCTNAIHHFKNLSTSFQECARVLSSGRLVIFCSTREQMSTYWLNYYFPKMMLKSIEQMPAESAIVESLRQAEFGDIELEKYFISPDLQDLFLYSGKQRPELYLDEEFRRNISSFASLAPPEEVRAGVDTLRNDIENGGLGKVMASFESNTGDYLFITATKHGRP